MQNGNEAPGLMSALREMLLELTFEAGSSRETTLLAMMNGANLKDHIAQ